MSRRDLVVAAALSVAAGVLFLAGYLAKAGSALIFSGLVTVNNTNAYSPTGAVGVVAWPAGKFTFVNGGLTSTNACTKKVQISIDSSNFVTLASFQFSVTNATNALFIMPSGSSTVWMRIETDTTNNVQTADFYQ